MVEEGWRAAAKLQNVRERAVSGGGWGARIHWDGRARRTRAGAPSICVRAVAAPPRMFPARATIQAGYNELTSKDDYFTLRKRHLELVVFEELKEI